MVRVAPEGAAERAASFDAFAVAAMPRLRRVAWALVRDWDRADDAVQGALERVWAAWPRVRRDDAYAYARTALVRLVVSEGRRAWRRHEVVTDAPPERVGDPGPQAAALDVAAALADLPPRQRAVVVLRYLEDASVADTARALGISEGTVKSTASDARTALRARFTDSPTTSPTTRSEARR